MSRILVVIAATALLVGGCGAIIETHSIENDVVVANGFFGPIVFLPSEEGAENRIEVSLGSCRVVLSYQNNWYEDGQNHATYYPSDKKLSSVEGATADKLWELPVEYRLAECLPVRR